MGLSQPPPGYQIWACRNPRLTIKYGPVQPPSSYQRQARRSPRLAINKNSGVRIRPSIIRIFGTYSITLDLFQESNYSNIEIFPVMEFFRHWDFSSAVGPLYYH